MTWNDFQEITAQIFRQLGCAAETDKRIDGARSHHDIDVYVTFRSHGFDVKWIIECKYWDTNIPQEKILALRAIVEDVGADKGIVITKTGFQPASILSSNNTNIHLLTFAELRKLIGKSLGRTPYRPAVSGGRGPGAVDNTKEMIASLRTPKANTFPEVYRPFLIENGNLEIQKAAASGLSKLPHQGSLLLLIERLGDSWGLNVINKVIRSIAKLHKIGGTLSLASTLLLDSRTYYDKIEQLAWVFKQKNDTKSEKALRSILSIRVPDGIDSALSLRQQVPQDIKVLLECGDLDLKNGVSLACFYTNSLWTDLVEPPANIESAIDYSNSHCIGLIKVLSHIDLTKWH
jgi:hypothetical protein